ncbi:MAG: Stk1 family PASTA domain-containing Ser/Thr kinase [Clostridiales Family XIII bacterium]|nr:Stk1 family PASTA domain-containing Ser/Thr kinase [Clostridiales Family XIII bacterium]
MGTLVLAGRYEILEKIGDGGMAVVYKARDKQLNRFVAIKILKKEFITDQTFVENFIREAKAAASLLHPNIVTIYDAGKDRDIYYIVMEYVEGRALSEVIAAEAPLDYKRCIRTAKQVASALSLAHRNNIIHRDVKPHNILITSDGTAKITDFGIAKAVSDGTIINDSGVIMGSVHYFSPEQSRGQYVDEKSDIYSLGIVLYEMITGRVPFDADNPVTIAVMHMNDTIIPPSRIARGVPPGLDQIVMKATAKFQSDRFGNIDEMYKALDNVNFITGIIDDPVIAGFVKPANMADEAPGGGYSVRTEPEEEAPPDGPLDDCAGGLDDDEPDYRTRRDARDEARTGDDDNDDDDEDEEREKKPGFFAALFGGGSAGEKGSATDGGKSRGKLDNKQKIVIIAVVVVIAIILSFPLSKVIGGFFAAEMVEVPDVVGLYVENATDILKAGGFSVEIETVALPPVAPLADTPDADADSFAPESAETPAFKEGQVMEQDPEGGTMAKEGKKVKLKVAGAPQESSAGDSGELSTEIKEVPDLVGKSKASAEYAIGVAGFRIGIVSYESSELPVDQVIAQSPKKGEQAPGNSPINIVVSTGPKELTTSVPSLVGKTEAEANTALSNAKLKPGTVTYQASDTVPRGYIISQNPAQGTTVKEGSAVNIAVSTGKDVVVPSLIGLDENQAKAALEAVGLVYANGGEEEAPAAQVGKVVSQSSAAGTKLTQGSMVTVTIGKPAIVATFTVTFVNWDGATLKTEQVASGGYATAPGNPSRSGYTFTGWDKTFSSVTSDLTVTATYASNPQVPSVVGQDVTVASAAINAAGLVSNPVQIPNDGTHAPGEVASTDPVGGTSVAPGSTVTISYYA